MRIDMRIDMQGTRYSMAVCALQSQRAHISCQLTLPTSNTASSSLLLKTARENDTGRVSRERKGVCVCLRVKGRERVCA